jgi:hypothetical protein
MTLYKTADDAIKEANKLESEDKIPYIITEDGFFKSHRYYPKYVMTCNGSDAYSNGKLPTYKCGETILEIRSKNNKQFGAKFVNNPDIIKSDPFGVLTFPHGLPIIPLSFSILLLDVEEDDSFEVEYEFYGDQYRKKLATTEYELSDEESSEDPNGDPDAHYGVKVNIGDDIYQVYGMGINQAHIGTYVKRGQISSVPLVVDQEYCTIL